MIIVAAAVVVSLTGCGSNSAADDPVADSTALLQERLDALKPGETLTLEPGVYPHSGILKVRVPYVTIDGGNAATLHATNDETSAVEVLADGVTITNLTLTAPADGVRWMGDDQHKLVVRGARSTISNVTVQGSAGAGIFLHGASHFTVENVDITGTRADGLHMTGGSGYGRVDGVRTDQTGDDGVAVVSYDHDSGPSHDISVTDVTVESTKWGRGITVVGGERVQISDFSVAKTSSAGLYIANEGDPFFTRSVDNVTVSDGTITGANWDAKIEQGSILVYAGNRGRFVRNVSISKVVVTETVPTARRNVAIVDETRGGAAAINGISMSAIDLRNTDLPDFYTNLPPRSFTTTDWTLNGAACRACTRR
jgi:hypothetical protein